MTIKKAVSLIIVLILAICIRIQAQPYSTGIGIRLGGIISGITVKHFMGSNNALEGIAGFGRHSFLITGLYEKNQPFPNAEGLSWFFGGGAHIGFFSNDYGYNYFYYKGHGNNFYDGRYYDNHVSFGGDFILGMEYKFKNAPVSLGLDVKPFVDFTPGLFGYWEGAFTIRFTL